MVKDASAFGELIRERRRATGLSQRDLASVADTGERFIVELEAGKPTCQLGKALAVAAALGIVLVDVGRPGADASDDPPDLDTAP